MWPLLIEPYRQPEFLMPAPRSRLPDLEHELRQLLATTPNQVRAALARTFRRSLPPPPRRSRPTRGASFA